MGAVEGARRARWLMRWLITGAGGMLGRDLATALARAGESEVTTATRADLDLLAPVALRTAVTGHDVVLNAAAWTDVDGAETQEEQATAINGTAVAELARICADTGAHLLHISTDYVFGGTAFGERTSPYPEDTPTDPINAYGRGKLVGEQAVREILPERGYLVRTAWLYGAHGPNFVRTMLRLAQTRDTVDVVTDQFGQPTWSYALATQLIALAGAGVAGHAPAGIYHGTAAGQTTWYGLARAVFEEAGLDPDRVRPTTSDKFPRPARRPGYSVLGHDRWTGTGVATLPDWRGMLSAALSDPDGVGTTSEPPRTGTAEGLS